MRTCILLTSGEVIGFRAIVKLNKSIINIEQERGCMILKVARRRSAKDIWIGIARATSSLEADDTNNSI